MYSGHLSQIQEGCGLTALLFMSPVTAQEMQSVTSKDLVEAIKVICIYMWGVFQSFIQFVFCVHFLTMPYVLYVQLLELCVTCYCIVL